MKTLTVDTIRSYGPCYDPTRHLAENWQGTILDILDNKEIPFDDRLWVIMRTELVSEKLMRLFAVWCARQVQHLMDDPRSLNALDVAERFANGLATPEELIAAADAAADAAWNAARTAAWTVDAARYAAWDAAWNAAWDAAWDAARTAAWNAARAAGAAWNAARAAGAAWNAAWTAGAARYAAWDAQETKLREMILAGVETGDVF